MIKTYNEYHKYLIGLVKKNNYQMLSDYVITQFISNNNLDVNHSITVDDVKTDIRSIISSNKRNQSRIQNKSPNSSKKSSLHKKVKDYHHYIKLLKDEIIKNDNQISDYQIKQFIKNFSLDKDWKVTFTEVRKDADDIIIRLKKNNSSNVEELNNDKANVTSSINVLNTIYEMCAEIIRDRKKLKAYLMDMIPDDRRLQNIICLSFDEGIPQELNEFKTIDNMTIQRLKNKLIYGYDISELSAEKVVRMWVEVLC